jgi:HEAT repeat protein
MPSHLAHWQALAASDPDRLIAALTSPDLPTWELTFAAEVAGEFPAARDALLALLAHASPVVREGAIYGLGKQPLEDDPALRARLRQIATADGSGAVREAALEALGEGAITCR